MTIETSPRDTDQRDRWSRGLVRHLRLDATLKPSEAWAIRTQTAPLRDGGQQDIYYTLVLHPTRLDEADDIRKVAENTPDIGGLFSPERETG